MLRNLTRQFQHVSKLSYSVEAKQQELRLYDEIKIPVPWGEIAGKWWGPKDVRPILTLHGWQDNCGSFDLLIPFLPKHLSYLTVDFPGHGLSSKIPNGSFYHGMDGPIMIKRLKDFFGWNKISLMGHSLGAITSYTYGFLYPQTVDFMICIDGLQPLINPKPIDSIIKSIDDFVKFEHQNSGDTDPPAYTLEEMAKRLNAGTRGSIDIDKCKYILERNILPSKNCPGKYFFNRDSRLKCGSLINWPQKDLLEAAKRVSFPIFISKAAESPFFSNKDYYETLFKILEENNKRCEFHDVPGTHHAHLNTPEIFKDILPKFIEKYDTEDRTMKTNLKNKF
ncbi:PREDICTED: probable serine hydrolase [Nicrophorus vespilloides]|uniref:Probable serine hydrolase n=1 Tax=Nicrophorus vespilloides TaxID=110193 RepID=A0ABM1M3N9_NICVS|nr:PREDICTED: probable serine hydrolase [Nicrophorus vespilloides]